MFKRIALFVQASPTACGSVYFSHAVCLPCALIETHLDLCCVRVQDFFYNRGCVSTRKKGLFSQKFIQWQLESCAVLRAVKLLSYWVGIIGVRVWEEGRLGAEGERVGTSTATSSLGYRQHTGHIVNYSSLSLPPCIPHELPYPPIYKSLQLHSFTSTQLLYPCRTRFI